MHREELQFPSSFEEMFERCTALGQSLADEPDQEEGEEKDSCPKEEVVIMEERDIGGEEEYDDVPEPVPVPLSPGQTVGISHHITMDQFTMLALVGKGGFGKVHQVLHKKTNEVLAMKTLNKKFLIQRDAVKDTIMERNVLRKIRHPFVVKLHYAFQSEHNVHLVMDFVNGGHLLFHMKRTGILPEAQARFYIAEVILALEHLHSLDIIHRDLKPENCLLDADGHCLLTDFGFAREDVHDLNCSSFCGTLEYMAPEVIKKKKYGKSADWWSLGILLYDMLNGGPPFQHKNDHALQKKILNGTLRMPIYFSNHCKDLITGLLQRSIEKRLKIDEIKSHRFFKCIDWEKLKRKELSPPFKPRMPKGDLDTCNFEPKYVGSRIAESPIRSPLSNSQQERFQGFSYGGSLQTRDEFFMI